MLTTKDPRVAEQKEQANSAAKLERQRSYNSAANAWAAAENLAFVIGNRAERKWCKSRKEFCKHAIVRGW